jgi:Fur family transcriptional regulator, stress-responsive regulator
MGHDREAVRRDLKDAGLRVTAPRLAVLETIRQRPHGTVDELVEIVRARLGAVSTQAVYDILAALEDNGLARKIEPAGHASRYEGRVGDNHHHVVCRLCGAVSDVDCVVGAMPCLEPSSMAGFVIDEAEVTFWGLCPACAGRPAPPPSNTSKFSKEKV